MADGKLTAKQEQFAQLYASGSVSASEAYRGVYGAKKAKPSTIHRTAHELLRSPKIAARVAALQAEVAETAKVTLAGHLSDMLDLRNRAAEAGDYGPAVRAEIARAQAAGLLVERREVTHSGRVVFTIPKNGRDGR